MTEEQIQLQLRFSALRRAVLNAKKLSAPDLRWLIGWLRDIEWPRAVEQWNAALLGTAAAPSHADAIPPVSGVEAAKQPESPNDAA